MTHNGLIPTKMVRSRVPHVAHFTLPARVRARVLILRALMLIALTATRPDARGQRRGGRAMQVRGVLGAYVRLVISTP